MPSDQPTPDDNRNRLARLAYGAVSAAPVESLQLVSERKTVAAEIVEAFAPELDAAYERGKAEGRPAPADVAILRKLLMSLPYWPTEAFAALDRIEGVEPAETEAPDA